MRRSIVALTIAIAAHIAPATAAETPSGKAMPGFVRVRMETSDGPIVLALDARHAPRTTANFLAYVDDGRLDGTTFYRASHRQGDAAHGFVEGGIGSNARRMLKPVALEPTSLTGLSHVSGTISMARYENPDSATCNFSILIGDNISLDAQPKDPGYAAFGHVIEGMATVQHILAEPTGGGSEMMTGEMILHPVRIISAHRLDGTPHPTSDFKPWLLKLGGDG